MTSRLRTSGPAAGSLGQKPDQDCRAGSEGGRDQDEGSELPVKEGVEHVGTAGVRSDGRGVLDRHHRGEAKALLATGADFRRKGSGHDESENRGHPGGEVDDHGQGAVDEREISQRGQNAERHADVEHRTQAEPLGKSPAGEHPDERPACCGGAERSNEVLGEPQLVGEVEVERRLQTGIVGEAKQERGDQQQLPRPDERAHLAEDGGQSLGRPDPRRIRRQRPGQRDETDERDDEDEGCALQRVRRAEPSREIAAAEARCQIRQAVPEPLLCHELIGIAVALPALDENAARHRARQRHAQAQEKQADHHPGLRGDLPEHEARHRRKRAGGDEVGSAHRPEQGNVVRQGAVDRLERPRKRQQSMHAGEMGRGPADDVLSEMVEGLARQAAEGAKPLNGVEAREKENEARRGAVVRVRPAHLGPCALTSGQTFSHKPARFGSLLAACRARASPEA